MFTPAWRRHALALLLATALAGRAAATEFDTYTPDKTGATDCSGALAQALKDTAAGDKVLTISPGTYLLAKPVALPSHLSIIAPLGRATLKGANRETDLLHCWRNQGNVLKGLNFTNCRRAITCEGDGYFATAKVIDCGFSNCDAGVDLPCVQVVAFTRCRFTKANYGVRGRRGYGGRSNFVIFNDCRFSRMAQWAIEIEGSPTSVRDCDIEGCAGGGIHLLDAMVALVEGCYFEGVAKERNSDVGISVARLHTGIVTVRNNQFNSGHADDRIVITGNSGAHIYDNFAYLVGGQRFVRDESTRAAAVQIDRQFVESSPSLKAMTPEAALKAADLVVKATIDQPLDAQPWDKVTHYRGEYRVLERVGGREETACASVRVAFCADGSPSQQAMVPKPGKPVVLYLKTMREKGRYRAFRIEPVE